MQIFHFLSHLTFIEVPCVTSVVHCAEQRLFFEFFHPLNDLLENVVVFMLAGPLKVQLEAVMRFVGEIKPLDVPFLVWDVPLWFWGWGCQILFLHIFIDLSVLNV